MSILIQTITICLGVFACVYICAPHMCSGVKEAKRGHQILPGLELKTVILLLGTKTRFPTL